MATNEKPELNPSQVMAFAATLMQLFPSIKRMFDGMRFLVEQPVIREPYNLGTNSATGGQVIAAGAMNQPLNSADFQHSLEWPFEVRQIKFDIDPMHTPRDWRVMIQDQTYNHQWMKNPIPVANLIEANTLMYTLPERWIIRPMGGGQQIYVDNLDTVNPIQVSVSLIGALLIPR